ncbi:MAG: LPP20 family lipoprotein [Deltaproteobacteria bacterium]|nr:LPP20 family lipoprotein [Deltaproteobacteria bacterium]
MSESVNHLIKTSLIILFLLCLLPGCGSGKASLKAERLKQKDAPAFTSGQYLKATGIGSSEKEARLNAKAELASVFESKVSSDVINRVRSVVEASGKETVTRDDERNIKVLSSVDLKGVEIGKTWYDEKQRAYYAIARLERAKARENWQKEVDRIDDEIELRVESLDSKKSDFGRFQSLKKARQLWLNREVALSRLNVIGYSDASMADYDIKQILSAIGNLQSQFLIYVFVNGDAGNYSEIITSEISEILSAEGYLITEDKVMATLIMDASLKVSPVELNNPDWKFARATLNLSISDKASGLTVGEISENKRASHLTYNEAAHKAVKAVAKMAAGKIINYFGSSD